MDPLTLVLLAAGVAWSTAAPDHRTLRATRGAVGAGRAVHHGAMGHFRAEWAKGGKARSKKRTARRKRWAKDPLGQVALACEWTGIYGYRAARSVARATRAGLAQAPAAYRAAAQTAVDSRAQRGPGRLQQWVTARLDRSTQADQTTDQDDMSGPDGPAQQEQEETSMGGQMGTGDLSNVGDLTAEVEDASSRIEDLATQINELAEWADKLSERVNSETFSTSGINSGVSAVAEAGMKQAAAIIAAFEEALGTLHESCRATEVIGEALDSQGATGRVEAFVAG